MSDRSLRPREPSASQVFGELIRQQGAHPQGGHQPGDDPDDPTAPAAPAEERPVAPPTESEASTAGEAPPDSEVSAENGERNAAQANAAAAGAARERGRVAAFFAGLWSFLGGALRALLILPLVAILAAAIATFAITWQQRQPRSTVLAAVDDEAPLAIATDAPRHRQRIGIVAGHRGVYNDPGAVCEEDGLTEREVNEVIAEKVVLHMRGLGYHAELLDEFDSRLQDYQAAALVSLHANDCQDYGEHVSGYLIARAAARAEGGPDDLLVRCIGENYAQATGLRVRAGLTADMTEYHSFVEIHPYTPAAILEMGFLRADRELLTGRTDIVARGVTDGILCFLAATRR